MPKYPARDNAARANRQLLLVPETRLLTGFHLLKPVNWAVIYTTGVKLGNLYYPACCLGSQCASASFPMSCCCCSCRCSAGRIRAAYHRRRVHGGNGSNNTSLNVAMHGVVALCCSTGQNELWHVCRIVVNDWGKTFQWPCTPSSLCPCPHSCCR